MYIFGENLRLLSSCLFHFHSVHDKNTGNMVRTNFFVLTLGTWAATALKFRPATLTLN